MLINCHVLIYLTISTDFHLIEFIGFYEVYISKRDQRTSMLKACIFPKSLTTWGGIFKSKNCEFFFHAYDQIDM